MDCKPITALLYLCDFFGHDLATSFSLFLCLLFSLLNGLMMCSLTLLELMVFDNILFLISIPCFVSKENQYLHWRTPWKREGNFYYTSYQSYWRHKDFDYIFFFLKIMHHPQMVFGWAHKYSRVQRDETTNGFANVLWRGSINNPKTKENYVREALAGNKDKLNDDVNLDRWKASLKEVANLSRFH